MKMKKLFFLTSILLVAAGCGPNTSSSASPNNSSSTPTLDSSPGTPAGESSSSSSGADDVVQFTKEDYGAMFGDFYSSTALLSIEEEQAVLTLDTETLVLKPTEKKQYVFTSKSFSEDYNLDSFIYETSDSRKFRAFIPHEASSWLVLEEKKGLSWKVVENFQPLFTEFLGAWNAESAGLKDTDYIFTNEFDAEVNAFKAEMIAYGTPATYYYQNYFTFDDINTMHHEIYTVDSDLSGWISFYVAETGDDGEPLILNDTDFCEPYLKPSTSYYSGSFFSTDKAVDISFDTDAGTMTFDDTTYNYRLAHTPEGYVVQFENSTSSGTFTPFYGGFYYDDGTKVTELVRANYASLVGQWYFEGNVIEFAYDEDKLAYVLKINGEETEYALLAKDRKFALQFECVLEQCTMTGNVPDISVVITKRGKEYYAANFVYFHEIFVGTTYAINETDVSTMTVLDDLTVSLDSKTAVGNYLYDPNMAAICYSFVLEGTTYYCYLLVDGVYYVQFGTGENDYSIYCSQAVLAEANGEWTTGGVTTELTVDMDLSKFPTITKGNHSSPIVVDYFTDTGLTFIYTDENNDVTLGGMITGSFVEYGILDNELIISEYYIHVEDFEKLVGTFILDGANGPEYIEVSADGTFKITGNTYDENGEVTGTALQEYEAYYSYMVDWNDYQYIAIGFYDPQTDIIVYCQFNGTHFTMFSTLNYYDEDLYNAFGLYKDPNSTNCLAMFSHELTFNGEKGTVTAATKSGEETTVLFTVSGTSYTAVFTNNSVHIIGDGVDYTYTKQEFDVTKFFGTWTTTETTGEGDAAQEVTTTYTFGYETNVITGQKTPTFKVNTTSITEYEIQFNEDGQMQLVFENLFTSYTLTLTADGVKLDVVDNAPPLPPLPPPPPPLPPLVKK